MPTENKPADPGFDLNTPDGGRGYIANLFKTVLKRHDYRQYIAERLAGDFACTLAQHFERITAERDALQQRLTAADERVDVLERDKVRIDWLAEQPVDTLYLDDGRIIDIAGRVDLRDAIDAAMAAPRTAEGSGDD